MASLRFGCLNNFCKITEEAIAAWCVILKRVDQSHLTIFALNGDHRGRVLRLAEDHGVDPSRIGFAGKSNFIKFMANYGQIDIAMDTFPFGGATTTCDALWMGVPVVSVSTDRSASRAGRSILASAGLAEFAADDVNQYVEIATHLAHDRTTLAALRAGLRERLLNSNLMNAPRFARNMEAAYREMWRRWVER